MYTVVLVLAIQLPRVNVAVMTALVQPPPSSAR